MTSSNTQATTDTVPDDGIERFKCSVCAQWVPVEYRCAGQPYGLLDPVCSLCVSYYEYLEGPDDPEEEEDD